MRATLGGALCLVNLGITGVDSTARHCSFENRKCVVAIPLEGSGLTLPAGGLRPPVPETNAPHGLLTVVSRAAGALAAAPQRSLTAAAARRDISASPPTRCI